MENFSLNLANAPHQVRVIFDIPRISELQDQFYLENVKNHISVHDMLTTLIYIEFIASEEDKAAIRSDFLATLQKRFKFYNVSNLSNSDFLIQCITYEDHIGVSPQVYLANPTAVWNFDATRSLEMRKKRYSQTYLEICDRIDRIYNALKLNVMNNRNVMGCIDQITRSHGNIQPRVEPRGKDSIILTFIDFSVI